MTISVLLCDDQELTRAGLRMILSAQPDMAVVGEAANGAEAVVQAGELRPDVVVMDVRMPVMDGIEATAKLRDTTSGVDARVLILTTFDLDEYVYAALRAGASGFLLKDAPSETLVDGIRVVASDEALLAPSVTRRLIEHFAQASPMATISADSRAARRLKSLTPRETETLLRIAKGLSNPEIAVDMFVSLTTVKSHVASVLMKLGVRDRTQAVVFAYEAGLVQPGQH